MPWVRIDEHALAHPKVRALSDSAFRLWVEGLAHCQQHLSDGVIGRTALRTFAHYRPARLKELLQPMDGQAALWQEHEHGYLVHDYLQWNESREHVLGARRAARDRMARVRGSREQATNERGTFAVPHHTTTQHTKEPKKALPRSASGAARWKWSSLYVSEKMHAIIAASVGPRASSLDWDKLYELAACDYAEQGEPADKITDLKKRAGKAARVLADLLAPGPPSVEETRAKLDAMPEQTPEQRAEGLRVLREGRIAAVLVKCSPDESFEAFWNAYPGGTAKRKRAEAEVEWKKLAPDAATARAIVAALKDSSGISAGASSGIGASSYPYPKDWLRKREWERAS